MEELGEAGRQRPAREDQSKPTKYKTAIKIKVEGRTPQIPLKDVNLLAQIKAFQA